MKFKYKAKFIAATLLFCSLWASTALAASQATLQVDTPARVARGDAFEVLLQGPDTLKEVRLHWRGKSLTVHPSFVQGAQGKQGMAMARVLLAVPVDEDEKNSTLPLAISAGGQKIQRSIALYTKPRPVQKLTVDKKYVNPPAHEMERIKADRQKVNTAIAPFSPGGQWQLPLYRPVPGDVSSLFGLRRVFNGEPRGVHKGLDMRAEQGIPIGALGDGVVVLSDNLYFSGNAVYVDHGQGVYSAYLHMSESHVTPGQRVQRGQTLGLVGATGRVTGPHLHLTLLVQGVHVDPVPFMEAKR